METTAIQEGFTNRQKVIQAIQTANARLRGEVHYQFYDVEHEDETFDMADAFTDASENIEENIPELKVVLQDFYIHIGYAIEIDITKVVAIGGKKYWFKRFGKHYDPICGWEQWINK